MSMTLIGARNETFNEIAQGIGFPPTTSFITSNTPETTSQFNQEVTNYSTSWKTLINLTNDTILSVANGIFIERTYPLNLDYLSLIRDDFQSNVRSSNFANDAENERIYINNYVSGRTNQLINDLIPLGALTRDTKLVLVNAIYFLGEWMMPFSKEATFKGNFKQISASSNVETKQVDFMSKSEGFAMYGENENYHWLSKPYSKDDYEMTFVVSKKQVAFNAESDLKFDQFIADSLQSNTSVFPTQSTNMRYVQIPKFKIEFESELSDTFKDENGLFQMVSAFERTKANLTGMIKPTDPAQMAELTLWIDKIFHKAFIKVDEMGTEAAAATASIIVGRTTSIIDEVDQKEFIADRPFAFILKRKDLILFVGKVNKL